MFCIRKICYNFTKGFSFACVVPVDANVFPPFAILVLFLCFLFLSIILVSIPLEIKIKYYELLRGWPCIAYATSW